VLEIELQGARQVQQTLPEAVRIFIAPPTGEALRNRLVGRGDTTPEDMDMRLQVARDELEARDEFDEVVVNDRLDDAVAELVSVVRKHLEAH
jgi:guanylate kinase